MAQKTGRKFRAILIVSVMLMAVGSAYSFWPRQAHLRRFDPVAVARAETSMWRDYYERKYVALFGGLYALSREQYGFSPWDSARLAWHAAKAAKVFQPTRSQAEAQAALPSLERYFVVMRRGSGEVFDVAKAAQLELDWWQLRRENIPPGEYSKIIAQVTTELYGVNNAEVQQSALWRADMMQYRDDRREGQMQAEDWTHIEEKLRASYRLFQLGISHTEKK